MQDFEKTRTLRQIGGTLTLRTVGTPLRSAPFYKMSANYKDTLLLPKTDFPMKADLVKREPERLAKWEAAGLYQQILDARIGAPLFVLHDGPPFANGDVHMGTALNKILKDLIVKSRSMLGFRAPFVPGWDCHGLPIEFKVVKEQRGLEPPEIRRRAEAFARKYIDIQRGQFLLKDNGDGTTLLTGNSWYQLYVFPVWYYDIWAKSITRNVHLRVMDHIKILSEQK